MEDRISYLWCSLPPFVSCSFTHPISPLKLFAFNGATHAIDRNECTISGLFTFKPRIIYFFDFVDLLLFQHSYLHPFNLYLSNWKTIFSINLGPNFQEILQIKKLNQLTSNNFSISGTGNYIVSFKTEWLVLSTPALTLFINQPKVKVIRILPLDNKIRLFTIGCKVKRENGIIHNDKRRIPWQKSTGFYASFIAIAI